MASVVQRRLPGEQSTLSPGDVVVFRGDQRHSYRNPGKRPAVGYSVVLLAPGGVRDGEDLAAIRLPYTV